MTTQIPFTDIHCHPLPELDDGAGSWEESIEMARLAAQDGIRTIIATPHQLGSFSHNRGDWIHSQTTAVQQRLDCEGIKVRILPGAEIRVEPGLTPKLQKRQLLSLANHGRHLLIEMPHDAYVPLDRTLDELDSAGLVGILAHPERNPGLLARPELVADLIRQGCLMQITAGSLLGEFGAQPQQFADWMLQQGLVHFVASDGHNTKLRLPVLGTAFEYVERAVGRETAIDLFCKNPAMVASGISVPLARTAEHDPTGGKWSSWRKAS